MKLSDVKPIVWIFIIAGAFVCGLLVMFFLSNIYFLNDFLMEYSAFITSLATIVLVIVTAFYAKSAKTQAKSSQESLSVVKEQSKLIKKQIEVATDQINLDKLPCIVCSPLSYYVHNRDYSTFLKNGGWKLGIDVIIENYGNSPAVSIITTGYLELQYSKDEDKIQKMSGCRGMITFIPQKNPDVKSHDGSICIYFSEKTLNLLINDINDCKNHHPEYSTNHPLSDNYGPFLVIQVVYKNLLGLWFMGTIKKRISYIEGGEPSVRGLTRVVTIPSSTDIPKDKELVYTVFYSHDTSSEVNYQRVSDGDVKKLLSEYSDIISISTSMFSKEKEVLSTNKPE